MVNAVVTGAAGRMGGQVIRTLAATEGFALVGATERPGFAAGSDAGTLAGLPPLGVPVRDDLAAALEGAKAQVVIDFTSPSASVQHARVCAEKGVALVIGSTGFTAEAREEVEAAARRIPVVLSPNMAVGVNAMFELTRLAARILGSAFDVEIVEMHHRKKKDAPSGTAVRLAEVAARELGLDPRVDLAYARQGMIGERPARQIGVQTLRGGDVVGEHTVHFVGEGERLEITHRAASREQFARGALRAARWVLGRPVGLYEMRHVLGL